MAKGYVVIMQHNFDVETRTVYFDEYLKAYAYLYYAWEQYINTEYAENPDSVIDEDSYCNGDYGLISYKEGDITEFVLSEVDDPINGFEELNWKYYLKARGYLKAKGKE